VETFDPAKREVLNAIEPIVEANLDLLVDVNAKKWWPSHFFSWMETPDYHEPLAELRREAEGLGPGILASIVGNNITEEALPNYGARLATLFPDPTGIVERPWNQWSRGWTAEEDMHGRVLNDYLMLTGRVNMEAVEKTIFGLLKGGFEQDADLYKGVLYPMFQEVATMVSHVNTGKIAKAENADTMATMCRSIAGDEARHARFYFAAGKALFEIDPAGALKSWHALMKDGIIMPALYMTDGETPAPDLYNNFASIAQEVGVYTPMDYADILRDFNERLGVADLRINGESGREQEYLARLPDRIEKIGAYRMSKKREPVPLSWLNGAKV
jgi:acyl-[acyl-carrier-protein] desaturase